MEENRVPFIALRGQTFFPNTIVGFDIGRDKSLAAVNAAMSADKMLVVSTQRDTSVNDPSQDDCYQMGILIRIKQLVKKQDEAVRVLASCKERVHILSVFDDGNMLSCQYSPAEDTDYYPESTELQAHVRVAKKYFFDYIEMTSQNDSAARALLEDIKDPLQVINIIASELDVDYEDKQEILEIDSVPQRFEKLIELINRENEILSISDRISSKVVKNMNQSQKEYYLREQMQVIKEELGETGDEDDEIQSWKNKLDELKLPEKVDTKVRKEIDKYSRMSVMMPDSSVARTYIETILELPWHNASKTNTNIRKAERILNEDHYGLEKVKERILENLAVMHLAKEIKGPIICLVGPPGVGKTSVARSIARATGREFVRMSLGGVRDEAEIRGHRRTYVGSIPGRVINAVIEAGTNNPLFLFDEVDKIGADFRGDPASALLEVLDPEQNKTFTDHYLEVPFDLSKIMFITTANTTSTIPRPLLDRMEVIELSSYIEEEKVRIAIDYLIPKKMKEYSIKPSQLAIKEDAIRDIIKYYTRESGVRNLERAIADICRKTAKLIVKDKKKRVNVTPKVLEKMLGKKIYIDDMGDLEPEVGVTTGMAWTEVGGVTLSIETVKMPGDGKLILTGQMGDVMKESAQAAMGYIKSVADKYEIDPEDFKKYDIQIHIPEGATPKDGPSAGITMFCALFSLLTDRPARRDISMTGEITLRGKVLRIGGLKEKALAAYGQGIRKILIPKENEPDIEDIPASIRKKITFVTLETVEDAIKEVIVDEDK